VRTTWELKAGELETIVRAYSEMGLAGLEADPLDARAELPVPVPRKPAVAPKKVAEVSPPKTVARPPKPPPEPQRPIIEPPKTAAEPVKVVANVAEPATVKEVPRSEPSWPFPPLLQKPPMFTQPGVPHLPPAHPRRATLTDRLRSYARVARPPHDRALAAVLLNTEGGSVNSAARDLAMPPAEVETWINLYHRRGAKAFLGADRLSLHPVLPPDKGSEIKAMAQKTQDEIYEKRLLIVADSIGGDDMVSICERYGVAYDEAAECIVAYDRHGLAGLERVDTPVTPAAMVAEVRTAEEAAARARARPQMPVATTAPMQAAADPEVQQPSPTAMFEGKNAYRLEAVREFNRGRPLQEVAKENNVGPLTIEKWVIAYVKTGMAERDRTDPQ
jgi:transposase